MTQPEIFGRDVLDVLGAVEAKTGEPNAQLTLLSSAISLVAIRHGIREKDLLRGMSEAFRQTVRKAPNFSRAHGAARNDGGRDAG